MIGAHCIIKDCGLKALVVGKRSYLGEIDRYAVRYIDNAGPQERWLQVNELSFDVAKVNVVEFRREAYA